jgi:Ca2+-binding EF-hand superfamily protein
MRSVCAIGFGLAILFASGSARAQEELTKVKPVPSVTIVVIEAQPGVVGVPVGPSVPAGGSIGRTAVPAKTTAAVAQPASKVQVHRSSILLSRPFQAMDANRDGKMSRAEFKGPQALFAAIDADRDGSVTRREATEYLAVVGLISLQEKARAFRTMDTNKDGKISEAEFKGPKAAFASRDANHDGVITPQEAIQAFNRHVRHAIVVGWVRSMDANHDGQITAAEFKGTVPQFVRLDSDHDGTISRADLAKVLRAPSAPQAAQATKAVAPVTKPVAAVTPTKVVQPVPVKPASQAPTPVAQATWAGRILAMDTNHDGKVCKTEYIKGNEARFAYLDQDKDGAITKADLTKVIAAAQARAKTRATVAPATAAQPTPGGRGSRLMFILAMDTNHDGKVCKAEYVKGIEARFTYLDQDKDGVITAADITRIVQARRTHPAPATQPAATGTPAKPVTGKPAAGVKTVGVATKP